MCPPFTFVSGFVTDNRRKYDYKTNRGRKQKKIKNDSERTKLDPNQLKPWASFTRKKKHPVSSNYKTSICQICTLTFIQWMKINLPVFHPSACACAASVTSRDGQNTKHDMTNTGLSVLRKASIFCCCSGDLIFPIKDLKGLLPEVPPYRSGVWLPQWNKEICCPGLYAPGRVSRQAVQRGLEWLGLNFFSFHTQKYDENEALKDRVTTFQVF